MTEPAWVEIDAERYEDYWEPFDRRFRFRAGMTADSWPAIDEPAPYLTLDLSPAFNRTPAGNAASIDAVNALALLGMVRLTESSERLLVLDWQHPSHWFWPHRQATSGAWQSPATWPVGVFPDGDYHAFLTEDMTNGTFGHPWEQTLCVFGERFVTSLGPLLSSWLPVKRLSAPTTEDQTAPGS